MEWMVKWADFLQPVAPSLTGSLRGQYDLPGFWAKSLQTIEPKQAETAPTGVSGPAIPVSSETANANADQQEDAEPKDEWQKE